MTLPATRPRPGTPWLLAAAWLVAVPVAWGAHLHLGLALRPANTMAWAWVLLGAPWLEEWIFRALLQQSLAQYGAPRWGARRAALGAAWLAAAAFALAHAPAHGLAATWWLLPGLALAGLWQQGAGLPACVATHAWFNACLAAVSAGAPPPY